MIPHIHTSNPRYAKKLWNDLGGTIEPVRRTGEVRYLHPEFPSSIRANDRRSDVPAVLLCRINKLLPTQRLSASRGPHMSGFRLFSKWRYCSNDKETYIEALRALQLRRPDLFEVLPRICGTSRRTFFARSPRALFPASPHLADVSSHYSQLVPGWYADTNLSNRQKERNLLHACIATRVDYLTDLEVRFEIGHYSPISSHEAARLADKLLLKLETL